MRKRNKFIIEKYYKMIIDIFRDNCFVIYNDYEVLIK